MPKIPPALQKKASTILLFAFLWGVFPLLSVEILMIVLEPYLFKGFFQYDPDIGFRVRAHTNGSNQFGFNDKDYPLEKPAGITRILVLGDSFGWVGGLGENYTTLMDAHFTRKWGENQVEVINAGYPMTHTGEQLKILEKYGLQYQPDIVVLGFFAGNDFFDADPQRKRIVVNDIYFDIKKNQELKILGYPIIPRSRLLLLIQQKYKVFQEQMKAAKSVSANPLMPAAIAATPVPIPPPSTPDAYYPPGVTEETYLNVESQMLSFYNRTLHAEDEFKNEINLVFESIDTMAELLESKNIKFIVAIYPAAFQVDENLANKLFEYQNLNRDDYDLLLAQKILKDYLDEKGIAYIDLLDKFKAEQQKQPLYIKNDTHWNRAGNQLAAEIIFKNLVPVVEKESGL